MANLLQFYLWYEKFETAAAELHTGMQCLSQHPLNKRESDKLNYFEKQSVTVTKQAFPWEKEV